MDSQKKKREKEQAGHLETKVTKHQKLMAHMCESRKREWMVNKFAFKQDNFTLHASKGQVKHPCRKLIQTLNTWVKPHSLNLRRKGGPVCQKTV